MSPPKCHWWEEDTHQKRLAMMTHTRVISKMRIWKRWLWKRCLGVEKPLILSKVETQTQRNSFGQYRHELSTICAWSAKTHWPSQTSFIAERLESPWAWDRCVCFVSESQTIPKTVFFLERESTCFLRLSLRPRYLMWANMAFQCLAVMSMD